MGGRLLRGFLKIGLYQIMQQQRMTLSGEKPAQLRLGEYLLREYVPRKVTLKATSIEQLQIACRSLERFAAKQAPSHETICVGDLNARLVCAWLTEQCRLARQGQGSLHTIKRRRGAILAIWRLAQTHKHNRQKIDVPPIRAPKRVPIAVEPIKLERCIAVCSAMPGVLPTKPRRNAKHAASALAIPSGLPWSTWWVSLLLATYDLGARINSMMSVRWEQIDLERGWILLVSESSKTDLEQVEPLSRQSLTWLRKLHTQSGRPQSGLVWLWPFGRRHLWVWWQRIQKKAGYEPQRGVAFHAIRRTNATLTMALCGIDEAARRLGHTSPKMTLSSYIDPRLLAQYRKPTVHLLPRLNLKAKPRKHAL